MKNVPSRRDFLRGVGLGMAACALPSLGAARAYGQARPPKRILIFSAGQGSVPGGWEPQGRGGDPPTEHAWELGSIMMPLAAHKRRMIMFENLDMKSTRFDPTGGANAHINGQTHQLTGAFRHDATRPGGPSIDQAIARGMAERGELTRLPTLEMATRSLGDSSPIAMASGEPVLALTDPYAVFERAFPAGGADDRAPRRRALVADFVRSEHEELIRRLPANRRLRIEQHLAARLDLEARLAAGTERRERWLDPSALEGLPTRRPDQTWSQRVDLFGRVAVAALHADVTRVVTLYVDDAPGSEWGYRDGDFGSENHHDLEHKVNGRDTPQSTDPAARAALERCHRVSIEKLAAILDGMAEAREDDGSTLLDNSVVVLTSHIANGSHSTQRMPWFTVGDCQGTFRTGAEGRRLVFDRATDPERRHLDHGRPHNDLLLTLGRAMGLEVESFGEPAMCTGPITEMLR